NTKENQFVKKMLHDLMVRIKEFHKILVEDMKNDDELLNKKITDMSHQLKRKSYNHFWRNIDNNPEPLMNLIIQMAPGYKDIFQIYLTISKGLQLQNHVHKMSLKDVSELYEYWTFL